VRELTLQNGSTFPLLGAKREGASPSPPSLLPDLGQCDGAVKEILAARGVTAISNHTEPWSSRGKG